MIDQVKLRQALLPTRTLVAGFLPTQNLIFDLVDRSFAVVMNTIPWFIVPCINAVTKRFFCSNILIELSHFINKPIMKQKQPYRGVPKKNQNDYKTFLT